MRRREPPFIVERRGSLEKAHPLMEGTKPLICIECTAKTI
jgi:hypothetical protein